MRIFNILSRGAIASLAVALIAGQALAQTAATKPELVVQSGHTVNFKSIQYSTNGQYLLTYDLFRSVKIWNAKTIELLGTLPSRMPPFFIDDTTIVVQDEQELRLLDILTFKVLKSIPIKFPQPVTAGAVSPDRKRFAVCAFGSLYVFDVESGKLLFRQTVRQKAVYSLGFTPDSAAIFTSGTGDQEIRFWDTATGKLKHEIVVEQFPWIVAISPDGKLLAVSERDNNQLTLRDSVTGAVVKTLTGLNQRALTLAFSSDSRMLAAGGRNIIASWGVESGALTNTLATENAPSTLVTFQPPTDPVTRTLVYGSRDLYVVKLGGVEPQRILEGLMSRPPIISAVPGRELVGTIGVGRGIKFWNMQSGEMVFNLEGAYNSKVAISPDGKYLLTAANSTIIWDAPRLKQLHELPMAAWHIKGHAFSPDSRSLAMGTMANTIELRHLATGEVQRTFTGHTGELRSIVISADGKTMASGSSDRTVRLWDMATANLIKTIQANAEVLEVDISPDGTMLAFSQARGTSTLYNLTTDKTLHTFISPSKAGADRSLFSPDGKLLLVSNANEFSAYATDTGAQKYTVTWISPYCRTFAVVDAKRIVGSMSDGSLQVRELATGRLMATLQLLTNRTKESDGPDEWIAFTPEGYYQGSPEVDKYVRWRDGGKLLPATAHATAFNLPEKVQQALAAP